MDEQWVTDVLGSEGIIGHGDYELPPMEERIGGPYELPEIGGCPPPASVAMAGSPLFIRHGDVEFWHERAKTAPKLPLSSLINVRCIGAAAETSGPTKSCTRCLASG